jgi:hypothetical protein
VDRVPPIVGVVEGDIHASPIGAYDGRDRSSPRPASLLAAIRRRSVASLQVGRHHLGGGGIARDTREHHADRVSNHDFAE